MKARDLVLMPTLLRVHALYECVSIRYVNGQSSERELQCILRCFSRQLYTLLIGLVERMAIDYTWLVYHRGTRPS